MPDLRDSVGAEIRSAKSGGRPLPLSLRRFMEPRFKADFSRVRIHTDDNAARLNQQVRARAFAVDNHVFFGQGQFQPETDPGRELIAHELTHTIQQGGALQRKQGPRVTQRSGSRVQRLGIGDALDYFADRAHNIPGFRMFTIIIGVNPINMSRVDRSAANILRAIVEFLPGGNLITRALDNHGIIERVAIWVERQFRTLAITGAAIRRALDRFLDSLSWRDIFSLGSVWNRARRIFTEPIRRLISFGRSLYRGIIRFIKDAILRPLAQAVSRTRGYDLLTAVLGFDPITGDAVPRTAETLIGGFMRLLGKQEVWDNIRRANAIPRAWAWFQGSLAGLMGFVRQIPRQFINTFRSLEIVDLVVVPRAVARVIGFFAGVAGRFFSWAGGQVMRLLQIIFEVVAPGVMPFIRRARGAFRSIIQNPAGFVRNLVAAGRRGLNNFAANFLTHLRTSLINWLTGAMSGAGVYIPQAFTLREILKFVLSVLGLTWQNLRVKLVRVIGETAVSAMESGFELVRTLVTDGPAAAWQKILEGLQNLRDMVIEQIMSFVQSRIVQAAITRLVSMLSPAGAFIQAIIATYNTIMFFIERMRTIAQVAMSFVSSIAAIAAGNIGAAAARVERTMAGLLTLVISFLARIAGLGRVADAVTRIIDRVRQPIDRALDRVVAWIVHQARRVGRFVAQAGVPQDPAERLRLGMQRAVSAVNRLPGNRVGEALINPLLVPIRARYGFQSLVAEVRNGRWWVNGSINPRQGAQTNKRSASGDDEVPEVIDQSLELQFVNGVGRPGEYRRQLGLQQGAINRMPVASWITNRNQYNARRRTMGSGRHPDAARVQRESRERTTDLLTRRLQSSQASNRPAVGSAYLRAFVDRAFASASAAQKANGFSAASAATRVANFMRYQHALHNPDQVAGGGHNPNATLGMGRAEVNWDIGANWGGFRKPVHLANRLHDLVNNTKRRMRRGKDWARDVWQRIKMRVALRF